MLPFELFIALKYITARKRQTALAMGAVGLAVAISCIFIALQNGFESFLIEIVVKNIAHITVSPKDGDMYLHLYRTLVERAWELPGLVAVSPSLTAGAILAHDDNVENVALSGVIPWEADKISGLGEDFIQGDFNSVLGGRRVVMGKALADKLEVKMEDTLEASYPDSRTLNLVLSGIYQTGYAQVDEGMAFVSLETAQRFVDEGDVVSNVGIKMVDIYEAPRAAEEIEAMGYNAMSWQELYPNILEVLAFQKAQNKINLLLLLVIAAFGIANVMNMLVLEKTRQIGMLMAMGARPASIWRIFILESGILGLAGGVGGSILGAAVSLYLGGIEMGPPGRSITLHFIINPLDIMTFNLAAVLLAIVAGLFAARKASRLDPVEALRG